MTETPWNEAPLRKMHPLVVMSAWVKESLVRMGNVTLRSA